MPQSAWTGVALIRIRATDFRPDDPANHDLHVDADSVCPRCLRWIAPEDIVRRTSYGPLEHESCPWPG